MADTASGMHPEGTAPGGSPWARQQTGPEATREGKGGIVVMP